jgi:hypothetical protein
MTLNHQVAVPSLGAALSLFCHCADQKNPTAPSSLFSVPPRLRGEKPCA